VTDLDSALGPTGPLDRRQAKQGLARAARSPTNNY